MNIIWIFIAFITIILGFISIKNSLKDDDLYFTKTRGLAFGILGIFFGIFIILKFFGVLD